MNLVKENAGRTAVIARAVSELENLVENNEISPEIAYGVLKRMLRELKTTDGIIVEFPRMEKDAFIRTEDINELVRSANYNYLFYSTEVDIISAIGEMISSLIDGKITAATEACQRAADAIGNLKLYSQYKASNPNSVVISKDMISTKHNIMDEYITANIISSSFCSINVDDVRTNGMLGNNLEFEENVPIGIPLSSSEIRFIDESNDSEKTNSLIDNDRNTLFETELYSIPNDIKKMIVPIKIEERIFISDKIATSSDDWGTPVGSHYSLVPVEWHIDDGELWTILILKSSNPISIIEIDPKINSAYQRIEFVQASTDGTDWYTIGGPTILAPNTSAFNDEEMTYRGKAIYSSHIANARYIKIKLTQDTFYTTIGAHAAFRHPTETIWIEGNPWNKSIKAKLDFFKEEQVPLKNSEFDKSSKFVFAIPLRRWVISLRNISAMYNKYSSSTIVETDKIEFNNFIERMSFSAVEKIPEGTNIKYSVTHDEETWIDIEPVERAGGREIIVYSSGGYTNPSLLGVTYVEVDEMPKTIRFRLEIISDGAKTPLFKSLIINPILVSGE